MAASSQKADTGKLNGSQSNDKSGQSMQKKDPKKKVGFVPKDIVLIDFNDELDNERSCESANVLMEQWMDNMFKLDWEDPTVFPPIPGWCTKLKCVGCGLSKSDKWYLCTVGHFVCKHCYDDHHVDRKPVCPAAVIAEEKGKELTGRCYTTPYEHDWNSPLGKLRQILEAKERLCCLDADEDHLCDVVIKDALGGQEYERHFELCDFFCANGCPFKTCLQGEMTAFQLVDHLLNEHKVQVVENDSKNELKFERVSKNKARPKNKKTEVKVVEDAFCPARATNEKARNEKLGESIMAPYMIKHDGVHFFMLIRRSEKEIQGWVSLMESNNFDNVKYSASVNISSDVKESFTKEEGKVSAEQFVFDQDVEVIRRHEVPETKSKGSFRMDWKTLEEQCARKGKNNTLIVNCRIVIKREE